MRSPGSAAAGARPTLPRARRTVRVEPRLELVLEHTGADRGLRRTFAGAMLDGRELTHELRERVAGIRRKVRSHTRAEVRRVADVQHTPFAVTKDVDARDAGEPSGQRQLGRRGVWTHPWDGQEVVEAEHP